MPIIAGTRRAMRMPSFFDNLDWKLLALRRGPPAANCFHAVAAVCDLGLAGAVPRGIVPGRTSSVVGSTDGPGAVQLRDNASWTAVGRDARDRRRRLANCVPRRVGYGATRAVDRRPSTGDGTYLPVGKQGTTFLHQTGVHQ